MALGIGYGLPFLPHFGSGADPYKPLWNEALEGAKAAGATVEDEGGTCLVARGSEEYNAGLPATPSLLIVPQFYKAGNLYQDVPPFVAEDSTMRFTVTRDTTATRVNSSGLIESVASGVPRIDWLGQSCPALLVEPSAQNLALQSEAFDNASWSKTNVSAVTGTTTAFTAPDGAATAERLVEDANNTIHRINGSTTTANSTQTFSVFAKSDSPNRYIQLRLQQTTAANRAVANFDLFTGQVLTSGVAGEFTSIQSSVVNFGNGWYRCIITSSRSVVSVIQSHNIYLLDEATKNNTGTAPSYQGDDTSGVYIWGAQLETGSVATTYIPTTTGTGTRNADQIVASGALVSGLIGQSQGCIYAEVDLRNFTASGRILTCSDNTSNERIMLQVGANRTLQAVVTTASADVCDISTASGQVSGIYKCALAYASGDFAFYVNGTQVGTDSSGGIPACTAVYLGKIGTSGTTNFLNDRIRAAALYTTRLTNAQLEQLTK